MRQTTPELFALLHGNTQFETAMLYTLTLVTGTVLRYTSADRNVTWNGVTYRADGPALSSGTTRMVLGLETDSLDVTIAAGPTDLLEGLPFIEAARSGALDGAGLVVHRAYFQGFDQQAIGALERFTGDVAGVESLRSGCKVTVKSTLEKLNIQMPRNLYQPSCLRTLYDEGCGVNRNALTVGGAVTGGDGTHTHLQSNLSQADGWFDQGVVQFTSGANAGLRRTVKRHAGGQFWFALRLPSVPAPGDAFITWPGCDKTQATCAGKFNNVVHFRGFPYIPAAETAA